MSIVLLRMRILPQRCASWDKSLPDYRVHVAYNRPFCKNRLRVVHLQGLLSHEVTLACVMHPYDNSHRNTTHHLPPCLHVQLFYTELGRFQVYLSNNFLCLRRLSLLYLLAQKLAFSLRAWDRYISKQNSNISIFQTLIHARALYLCHDYDQNYPHSHLQLPRRRPFPDIHRYQFLLLQRWQQQITWIWYQANNSRICMAQHYYILPLSPNTSPQIILHEEWASNGLWSRFLFQPHINNPLLDPNSAW